MFRILFLFNFQKYLVPAKKLEVRINKQFIYFQKNIFSLLKPNLKNRK